VLSKQGSLRQCRTRTFRREGHALPRTTPRRSGWNHLKPHGKRSLLLRREKSRPASTIWTRNPFVVEDPFSLYCIQSAQSRQSEDRNRNRASSPMSSGDAPNCKEAPRGSRKYSKELNPARNRQRGGGIAALPCNELLKRT